MKYFENIKTLLHSKTITSVYTRYQEVYKRDESGQLLYSKRLRTDLDEFLWNWLHNIKEQGYSLKEKEQ